MLRKVKRLVLSLLGEPVSYVVPKRRRTRRGVLLVALHRFSCDCRLHVCRGFGDCSHLCFFCKVNGLNQLHICVSTHSIPEVVDAKQRLCAKDQTSSLFSCDLVLYFNCEICNAYDTPKIARFRFRCMGAFLLGACLRIVSGGFMQGQAKGFHSLMLDDGTGW